MNDASSLTGMEPAPHAPALRDGIQAVEEKMSDLHAMYLLDKEAVRNSSIPLGLGGDPDSVERMRKRFEGVCLPFDIHRRPMDMRERIAAGAFAPALACVLVNPFSTVRVRMQLQGKEGQPKIYASTLDCFRQIHRKEGWRGLQRGLKPAIAREFTMGLLKRGTMEPMLLGINLVMATEAELVEESKRHSPTAGRDGGAGNAPESLWQRVRLAMASSRAPENMSNIPLWHFMLAGGVSNAMVTWLLAPIDLVKVRLKAKSEDPSLSRSATQHQYSSATSGALHILRTSGLRGLYFGSHLHALRGAVSGAIALPIYLHTRFYMMRERHAEDTLKLDMFCGLVTGAAMTVVGTPLQVLSVRFFNQHYDYNTKKGFVYTSTPQAIRRILQTEGPTAFYKGSVAAFMRAAPYLTCIMSIMGTMRRSMVHEHRNLDLHRSFASLDEDGDGVLSERDIRRAISMTLLEDDGDLRWVTADTYQELLARYLKTTTRNLRIKPGDPGLEFCDYERLREELLAVREDFRIRSMYLFFTKGRAQGQVTQQDVARTLRRLLPRDCFVEQADWDAVLDQCAHRLIEVADRNHDGRLQYEEFKELVSKLGAYNGISLLNQWYGFAMRFA